MITKNIIAIGGGGFGRSLGNLLIEKYIVSVSNKKFPKVCFIPTASGDNDLYKLNFYRAFSKLRCINTHIDFFSRTEDLEKVILNQDIIYVGGGNTKSMIAVWKDWNLDEILRNAYNSGIVMSGVSAGAICWFERGVTDSYAGRLDIINCLGFVEGLACPHYDEEKERKPYVMEMLKKEKIDSCFCIEGLSALHIINGIDKKSINFGEKKKSFEIFMRDKIITQNLF
tara:strand:- start:3432 stop:4112 length:681 start_codon:yes stop_codon:yes gene_type:complete